MAYFFFAAFFFAAAGVMAGLVLPNDPLNLFPFAVFLSPRPMFIYLESKIRMIMHEKKLRPAVREGAFPMRFGSIKVCRKVLYLL